MEGAALARAAAELVGTPFQLHGTSAEHGVDCVGVVACALARIGHQPRLPQGYGLRNSRIEHHLAFAAMNGLSQTCGPLQSGDVVLVVPGPGQHHLLIVEDVSHFIHAHAGLRKVVRMPGPLTWPIEQHWRLSAANSR